MKDKKQCHLKRRKISKLKHKCLVKNSRILMIVCSKDYKYFIRIMEISSETAKNKLMIPKMNNLQFKNVFQA
jgi:hypothetical protein